MKAVLPLPYLPPQLDPALASRALKIPYFVRPPLLLYGYLLTDKMIHDLADKWEFVQSGPELTGREFDEDDLLWQKRMFILEHIQGLLNEYEGLNTTNCLCEGESRAIIYITTSWKQQRDVAKREDAGKRLREILDLKEDQKPMWYLDCLEYWWKACADMTPAAFP
jgi:hypothetical protein